jgi:hypothetical protein
LTDEGALAAGKEDAFGFQELDFSQGFGVLMTEAEQTVTELGETPLFLGVGQPQASLLLKLFEEVLAVFLSLFQLLKLS